MMERKPLIIGILLSAALHIFALWWRPAPTPILPPRLTYLEVEVIAGTTLAAAASAKGLQNQASQGNSPTATNHHQTTPPEAVPARAKPFEATAVKRMLPETNPATETLRDSFNFPSTGPDRQPVLSARPDLNPSSPLTTLSDKQSTLEIGPPPNKASVNDSADIGKSLSGYLPKPPVFAPLAYGSNPPPRYPDTARRRGWAGEVILRVEVSAEGEVNHIAVKQSSGHAILDEAARQGVFRWRFRSALQDGRPVPGEVLVPVRFELKARK